MDKISLRGAAMLRANDDSRVITFRASTGGIDRHGTRMEISGIDTANFLDNPIIGWAHDLYGGFMGAPRLEHVLGRAAAVRKTSSALDVDVEFLPASVNPLSEMALQMVKARALNAVSIGFIPRDVVMEMHDGIDVPVIKKSELLEISVVSIPSNPEALALTRQIEEFVSKHRSTPPESPADLGVVIDALKGAFTEWQVREAFRRSLS